MKFKKGVLPTDAKDRLKYLYRFQEMLILFHNVEGKKFREGKIKEDTFRRFQKGWIRRRNLLLCQEINKCKSKIPELVADMKLPIEEQEGIIDTYKAAKKDKKIHINITDIEED